MNVQATQPSRIPAQGAAQRRTLDVTVSDGGVQQRPQVTPVAAPRAVSAPVAPTSTAQLAATLSSEEQAALTQRFANLPREGVTSGVYDVRGRTPGQPSQAQQGRLLDVTG